MLTRLRSFLRKALRRSDFEEGMRDELQFHIESRALDLVRTGLTPEDAKRRARLEFGNPDAYRDQCRESTGLHLVDDARMDARFAWRMLRREAVLSATVILTLALGIGGTTAIFSVVNGVLLRPLPLHEPDRLMQVGPGGAGGRVFGPDFVEWRRGCRRCEDMAAFTGASPANLAGGSEPDRVRIGRVTGSFFSTIGVAPAIGRPFLPEESDAQISRDGTEATVPTAIVLSDGLWRRLFAADPAVIGRTVRVEGDPCTVVGVMPRGFTFVDDAEAWVPATVSRERGNSYLQVIARLAPGAGAGDIRADVESVAARLHAEIRDARIPTQVGVAPLADLAVGDVKRTLLLLLGAVGLVLLIACANVANLLLAQAATRPAELAIRTALGAGRGRLVRQLLTEYLLLSSLGGILGVALAAWLVGLFVANAPSDIPRLESIAIDRSVLGFAVLLSLATSVLCGIAPMRYASNTDPGHAIKDGGARAGRGPTRRRLRTLLVVAEVSLTLVLLIGSGLLVRSLVLLHRTPLGIDPAGRLTASVTLPGGVYASASRAHAYYRDVLERIAGLPDVKSSGMISALPLTPHGMRISGDVRVEGETKGRGWARKVAIGGAYFRAAGLPLVGGRVFDDRDTDTSLPVVIVSQALAARLWPGADPLGKRLNIGFGGETWREVVGVVGDAKQDLVGEKTLAALYHPYQQVPDGRRWMLGDMTFVVQTAGPPERSVSSLRAVFAEVDRDLPLFDVATFERVVARNTADPAFYTVLLSAFALLALALASAGLYGLVVYSVAQRRHEIGLRMALGARASAVVGMVIGEGMRLVAAGAVLGVLGAWAATRLLTRFLYGVTPADAPTFAGVSALLAVVALAACYLPARRAARVDPIVALRHD